MKEFKEMRKKIKKPLTKRGLELNIKKLYSLTKNVDEQIEIVNNSIMNNWLGLYPLKKEQRRGSINDFKKLWEEESLKDEQEGSYSSNATFIW